MRQLIEIEVGFVIEERFTSFLRQTHRFTSEVDGLHGLDEQLAARPVVRSDSSGDTHVEVVLTEALTRP